MIVMSDCDVNSEIILSYEMTAHAQTRRLIEPHIIVILLLIDYKGKIIVFEVF